MGGGLAGEGDAAQSNLEARSFTRLSVGGMPCAGIPAVSCPAI